MQFAYYPILQRIRQIINAAEIGEPVIVKYDIGYNNDDLVCREGFLVEYKNGIRHVMPAQKPYLPSSCGVGMSELQLSLFKSNVIHAHNLPLTFSTMDMSSSFHNSRMQKLASNLTLTSPLHTRRSHSCLRGLSSKTKILLTFRRRVW